MRAVRLLLAGVLGALPLVVVTGPAAFACSCVEGDTAQHVDGATVVFTGTATDKEPPPQRPVMSSGDPVTYTFDAERAFKGDVPPSVPVLTAMSGASCGLEGVRLGQRYVVFASQDPGGDLWASLCGGTAPWSADLEAQVVSVAGPGEPDAPAAELGSLALPVALASGLVLVLLAAALWLRLLLRR